jgi:Serine carboxypeptidase S28
MSLVFLKPSDMDGAGYMGGKCQAFQGALLPARAQILWKKPPHKVKNSSFILICFNMRLMLNRDMSVKNLVYLSSEQALADLAFYIRSMNRKYALPKEVQWVTFGGSYPGSLSAWMRLKYPHLVHAAVSASGPLLAVADFSGKNIKLKIAELLWLFKN